MYTLIYYTFTSLQIDIQVNKEEGQVETFKMIQVCRLRLR